MVILIAGSSHTGKTLLAQRLLEKYKFPYLSIDHLKMGLIWSGNTLLTPEDDEDLTKYLSQKGISNGDYELNIDYRLDNKFLGYGGYVITVVYKDDPSVTYGYDFSNGKISNKSVVNNIDVDNKNFKHEN